MLGREAEVITPIPANGVGEVAVQMKGQQYLLHWVLPNFFFHVTTAYNLLRHSGVEVGKINYLGKYQ